MAVQPHLYDHLIDALPPAPPYHPHPPHGDHQCSFWDTDHASHRS